MTPSDWLEYRGLSYPIGVDDEALSIASIPEHYTPLQGVSRGHGKPLQCASKVCGRRSQDGLNAAISGSVAVSLKSQVTGMCRTHQLLMRMNVVRVEPEEVGTCTWERREVMTGY
jgi:hypothetical protein